MRRVALVSLCLACVSPVLCRPLAKFEPPVGCYVGAYILLDRKTRGDFELFEQLTGKKHASYFHYVGYGKPFPMGWAQRVKQAGAIPHIAWEPNEGLDKVRDDEYLREWAADARELDSPIFLRFASEMNGTWMPYSGDPRLYVAKFRLVHDVMERVAPNVAMVWCVFATPISTIPDYYPGDEYVDWVGVNIYSVYVHDEDATKPAGEDPRQLLRFVYRRYADRKPIQISEYAASHYCKTTRRDLTQFAIARMSVLYSSLQRDWPAVKMINWFSVDAAGTGLAGNNYSLTDNEHVLAAYRRLVAGPYFLSAVPPTMVAVVPPIPPVPPGGVTPPSPPMTIGTSPWAALPPEPTRGLHLLLQGAQVDVVSGELVVIAEVGTEEDPAWVSFTVDEQVRKLANRPPFRFAWDTARWGDGTHTLRVTARSRGGAEIGSEELVVDVQNE